MTEERYPIKLLLSHVLEFKHTLEFLEVKKSYLSLKMFAYIILLSKVSSPNKDNQAEYVYNYFHITLQFQQCLLLQLTYLPHQVLEYFN